MTVNHASPGKFRVRLNVPGPPVTISYFYEAGAAESLEAAGDEALQYWRSDAWSGPIESANVAEVFRYSEDGEIETAPSFVLLLSAAGTT